VLVLPRSLDVLVPTGRLHVLIAARRLDVLIPTRRLHVLSRPGHGTRHLDIIGVYGGRFLPQHLLSLLNLRRAARLCHAGVGKCRDRNDDSQARHKQCFRHLFVLLLLLCQVVSGQTTFLPPGSFSSKPGAMCRDEGMRPLRARCHSSWSGKCGALGHRFPVCLTLATCRSYGPPIESAESHPHPFRKEATAWQAYPRSTVSSPRPSNPRRCPEWWWPPPPTRAPSTRKPLACES